jgi:hypothetical protein
MFSNSWTRPTGSTSPWNIVVDEDEDIATRAVS